MPVGGLEVGVWSPQKELSLGKKCGRRPWEGNTAAGSFTLSKGISSSICSSFPGKGSGVEALSRS